MVNNITAAELKPKWDKDEVLLIDVREHHEHTEYIRGAYLIPLADLSASKLPRTSKQIVVHCGGGKRSIQACEKLQQEDPSLRILNLLGGMKAWKDAGFPTERNTM